jgi:hypothetical protein
VFLARAEAGELRFRWLFAANMEGGVYASPSPRRRARDGPRLMAGEVGRIDLALRVAVDRPG